MRSLRSLAVGFGLLILSPLSSWTEAPPLRVDADDLSQEYATFRRAQVAEVFYELKFAFDKGATTFEGTARLHVRLHHADAPLSIDLVAETLDTVRVNGVTVSDLVQRTGSFDIPASYLRAGKNDITIQYTGAYSDTGQGLCHMVDPVDGKEYFYTNLEPYGAHRVFPCFDQPDIKARFSTTVTTPNHWRLIGNEPVVSGKPAGDNSIRKIGQTPLLSTYLFFLGGGEYEAWFDNEGDTPLAIYARASLAEHVDSERLFAETKAGLDYFNRYFGTPYPFKKYDHIFAPELQPGAMENPGAVTMNEYMIFRGPATAEDYRSRNNTLLHEMAHMWFGDLVTMVWWNDLWLNESFATFSSYQAQAAMGESDPVWRDFYGLKGWAYYQDQLSTTHPIETEVTSAQLATANFDGITYAKGASALKQLAFFVGDGAYQRGVARYFQQYAWQNATRAQFIAEIAEAADEDLNEWTHAWLQTEGLATISIQRDEHGARLRQQPHNTPRLAPHRTRIGAFHLNESGKLVLTREETVSYHDSEVPLPWLTTGTPPDFVYANYGDMDYGLFFLDDHSFQTALTHLAQLESPFTRQMIWGTLFSMVRHQRLAPTQLMNTLLKNMPLENDVDLLGYLLGGSTLSQLNFNFLTPEQRNRFAPDLENILWTGYESAPEHSDAKLIWQDAFVRLASRPETGPRLESLLNRSEGDPQRRWRILSKLTVLATPDMEPRIVAELERDPSAMGQRYALSCRVAVPTIENKEAHWGMLTDPTVPVPSFRSAAGAFQSALWPELSEPFAERWLAHVRATDWESQPHRIRTWFGSLFPPITTPEALEAGRNALESSDLSPRATRAWQEALDRAAQVVAVRNQAAALESN